MQAEVIKMLSYKGFTLIELLITIVILGIIVGISSASYQGLIANQALSHRADQVYFTLQLAKSEAIKRNKKVYVHFCEKNSAWKMGLSESGSCECFTANSCQLDGIEKVQDLVDGEMLFIKSGDLTFTGEQTSYGALRFTVATGTVTLTNSQDKSLSIVQSTMRLRVCSPDVPRLGHPTC